MQWLRLFFARGALTLGPIRSPEDVFNDLKLLIWGEQAKRLENAGFD